MSRLRPPITPRGAMLVDALDAPAAAGVKDGVLTVVEPVTGAMVSLPWPPPAPPTKRLGAWVPAILACHPDGTATAVWRWLDAQEAVDAVRG